MDEWASVPEVVPGWESSIPPPPPPTYSPAKRKIENHSYDAIYDVFWKDEPVSKKVKRITDIMEEHTAKNTLHVATMQEHKLRDQLQRFRAVQRQLHVAERRLVAKSEDLFRKERRLRLLEERTIQLEEEVDTHVVELQITRSEHEERMSHYKKTVKDLQVKSTMSQEADNYLKLMFKLLTDYECGQEAEGAWNSTHKQCSVCLTNPACVVCAPCNHLEWCLECAQTQFRYDSSSKVFSCEQRTDCPRCRQKVDKIERIFI